MPGGQLGAGQRRGRGAAADGVRYVVDTQMLEDENTGVNPQPIKVRRLNLKLLLSTQDHSGYEVDPARPGHQVDQGRGAAAARRVVHPAGARLRRLAAAGGGHPPGDLRPDRQEDRAAGRPGRRRGTSGSTATRQGDPLIFAQLRELNEAYARLGVLAFAEGVHPLEAYLELAQLVGQLSIFGATRRPPDLPRYDHDDLGGCFYRVKQHIDALLDILVEPDYKERPFIGAGLRMQVALEPAWLESVWEMYIGVQSPLDADECIRLLTKPGQLDMKVGSSDRVDTIFRMGLAGLRFAHSQNPPRPCRRRRA